MFPGAIFIDPIGLRLSTGLRNTNCSKTLRQYVIIINFLVCQPQSAMVSRCRKEHILGVRGDYLE